MYPKEAATSKNYLIKCLQGGRRRPLQEPPERPLAAGLGSIGLTAHGWHCLVPESPLSGWLYQTCQLSRVTRESHGFLHFLQSHGRGNSCSRVYSCPTVLFSHRLLPIIIAGNMFWQHKFSVNETEACFFATGKFRGATEAT